jgi:hypothetical protein
MKLKLLTGALSVPTKAFLLRESVEPTTIRFFLRLMISRLLTTTKEIDVAFWTMLPTAFEGSPLFVLHAPDRITKSAAVLMDLRESTKFPPNSFAAIVVFQHPAGP